MLPRLVFPGDAVSSLLLAAAPAGATVRLGAGLNLLPSSATVEPIATDTAADEEEEGAHSGDVLCTRAGLLVQRMPGRFSVLSAGGGGRYVAAAGDAVVGVVVERGSEAYRVSLHGACGATLPVLAFDGASKRNKPSLAVGTLVFCRVAVADRHLDVELTCCAPAAGAGAGAATRARDWMSGASLYGELKGGMLVRVSLAHARRLLRPRCSLLAVLGSSLAFEVAIGVNGLVYVRAQTTRQLVIICNAIERSGQLDEEEAATFARTLAAAAADGGD